MRKFAIAFTLLSCIQSSFGQTDLAFYQLGDRIPQGAMNNASFFPDAEFYFSLPAMSGLNVRVDNAITYNHLFLPVEGTDSVKVDLENALNNLKEGDNLRFRGDVSLFQFGVRAGNKTFSLFYNLRYSGGMTYPVQFLNYFVYGNGNYIGQEVEEKSLQGGGIAFSEIGLGYTQEFYVMDDRRLTIGGRFKLLNGIAQVSSQEDASVTMYTDPVDYDLSVQFTNAVFRTAGLNELQGDNPVGYLSGFGANKNKGFALDIGASLEINEKLVGFLSVNDFGTINWKQDVENYTLIDNEIVLTGYDNLDDIDVFQALEDSLDVWTETETSNTSYRTSIGTRYLLGANYQLLENGVVSGSISRNGSSYGFKEYGLALGYTHQFGTILALSTSAIKEQNRPLKMGGGFELRLGALQIYGAFNDILNVVRDPADTYAMDARFGINFLIGRKFTGNKANREKKVKEELSPFPPEYDLDHILDSDSDQ